VLEMGAFLQNWQTDILAVWNTAIRGQKEMFLLVTKVSHAS